MTKKPKIITRATPWTQPLATGESAGPRTLDDVRSAMTTPLTRSKNLRNSCANSVLTSSSGS